MRHLNKGRNFSRTSSHRKAMFKNMMVSLITHEFITTTLPKGKEVRMYLEPLITMAKVDSLHNRRLAFSKLRDRDAVQKLFNDIAPHFMQRPGGYLRVLKAGHRKGDCAPLAIIELVGREKVEKAA